MAPVITHPLSHAQCHRHTFHHPATHSRHCLIVSYTVTHNRTVTPAAHGAAPSPLQPAALPVTPSAHAVAHRNAVTASVMLVTRAFSHTVSHLLTRDLTRCPPPRVSVTLTSRGALAYSARVPLQLLATWPHSQSLPCSVTRRGSQSDHFSLRAWHVAAPGAMFEPNQLLQ